MTDEQFLALAKLLRMRGGASQEVARLALVEGLSVPDAAARVGLELRSAYYAVESATAGYALAKKVCGST